jgi:YEATS domain-containing protein 4
VSHGIKLYPPGTPANAVPTDTETPVVAESYDEVVFTDPTEFFFEQLQKVSQLSELEYSQQEHFPTYSDTEDAQALIEAEKFLQRELAAIHERMQTVDQQLQATDEEYRQAQERQKAQVSSSGRSNKSTATTSSATTKKK